MKPEVSVEVPSEVNTNIYQKSDNLYTIEEGRNFDLTCTSTGPNRGRVVWKMMDRSTGSKRDTSLVINASNNMEGSEGITIDPRHAGAKGR